MNSNTQSTTHYRTWLQQLATEIASSYDGSEASEVALIHLLIKLENEEKEYKLRDSVSGLLDEAHKAYQQYLQSDENYQGNSDAFLERLEQSGAVVVRDARCFVKTDSHAPEIGDGDGNFTIKFQPRLSWLVESLHGVDIYVDDVGIQVGSVDPETMRQAPYIIVDIPRQGIQFALCEHVGNITYFSDQIREPEFYDSNRKSEIEQTDGITTIRMTSPWTEGWREAIQRLALGETKTIGTKVDVKRWHKNQTPFLKDIFTIDLIKEAMILHMKHLQETYPSDPVKWKWPSQDAGVIDVPESPLDGKYTWKQAEGYLRIHCNSSLSLLRKKDNGEQVKEFKDLLPDLTKEGIKKAMLLHMQYLQITFPNKPEKWKWLAATDDVINAPESPLDGKYTGRQADSYLRKNCDLSLVQLSQLPELQALLPDLTEQGIKEAMRLHMQHSQEIFPDNPAEWKWPSADTGMIDVPDSVFHGKYSWEQANRHLENNCDSSLVKLHKPPKLQALLPDLTKQGIKEAMILHMQHLQKTFPNKPEEWKWLAANDDAILAPESPLDGKYTGRQANTYLAKNCDLSLAQLSQLPELQALLPDLTEEGIKEAMRLHMQHLQETFPDNPAEWKWPSADTGMIDVPDSLFHGKHSWKQADSYLRIHCDSSLSLLRKKDNGEQVKGFNDLLPDLTKEGIKEAMRLHMQHLQETFPDNPAEWKWLAANDDAILAPESPLDGQYTGKQADHYLTNYHNLSLAKLQKATELQALLPDLTEQGIKEAMRLHILAQMESDKPPPYKWPSQKTGVIDVPESPLDGKYTWKQADSYLKNNCESSLVKLSQLPELQALLPDLKEQGIKEAMYLYRLNLEKTFPNDPKKWNWPSESTGSIIAPESPLHGKYTWRQVKTYLENHCNSSLAQLKTSLDFLNGFEEFKLERAASNPLNTPALNPPSPTFG